MKPSDHRQALPADHALGQYRILEVLGVGGFGITYLAEHRALAHRVALKEYLPNEFAVRDGVTVHPKSGADRESFEWGLARFLEEARTLTRFRHPNLVRVLDFFEGNRTAYMAMEYEEGKPLDELLARGRTLDESQLRRVILPIVDGLKQVHAAGILHRDIKPSNIFVRVRDESPVLLDFGAARQALGRRSRTLTAIASAGYSPPEQYEGSGEQGPWTDIYGLCATCYRAIAGETPVDAPSRIGQVARGRPDPLPGLATTAAGRDYSRAFLDVLDRGLRVIEAERPRSLDEFLDSIEGGVPAPARGLERAGRPRRTLAWLVCGGAAVALGALAVAFWPWIKDQFFPGRATLTVITQPPGAEVVVNDDSLGTTPLEEVVSAGTAEVTLRHPLHETVRLRNQRLEDRGRLRIERTLVRATGALRISTRPPGTWVERDGERLPDATPTTLSDLPAGPLTLTLGAPEHRSAQVRTEVPKDAVGTLEHALEPIPHGTLTLELQPPDAQVTLPDIAARYRPGMRLPEGSYRVTATLDGYRRAARTVEVAGDTQEQIALERVTTLTVRTQPRHAQIRMVNLSGPYRDGMQIPPNDYEVVVDAPNHEPFRGTLLVDGPTVYEISLCELKAREVTRYRTESRSRTRTLSEIVTVEINIPTLRWHLGDLTKAANVLATADLEPKLRTQCRDIDGTPEDVKVRPVNMSECSLGHDIYDNVVTRCQGVGDVLCGIREDVQVPFKETLMEPVCPDEVVVRL